MQSGSNPSFTGTASASTSTAALRTRPVLPLAVLPEPFRAVFPYPNFNRVQSMCFDAAFHTDENMVVAAPTGKRDSLAESNYPTSLFASLGWADLLCACLQCCANSLCLFRQR
jgi:hypothetical protein